MRSFLREFTRENLDSDLKARARLKGEFKVFASESAASKKFSSCAERTSWLWRSLIASKQFLLFFSQSWFAFHVNVALDSREFRVDSGERNIAKSDFSFSFNCLLCWWIDVLTLRWRCFRSNIFFVNSGKEKRSWSENQIRLIEFRFRFNWWRNISARLIRFRLIKEFNEQLTVKFNQNSIERRLIESRFVWRWNFSPDYVRTAQPDLSWKGGD